ncbi:MAG: IS3 family transposase [Tepidimonas sp.]|uniref:IS3 family transposase n=1 Tax=Tepidimonas sp. TaxID=2002775 RepID=UPI00259F0739|nr:IS3 family transposase [Tepidimonas sp.]MDM7456947.1 IS3 family transposase [Tepidimonas sp.]
MRKSRFTQEQIIGFIKQADAGVNVAELCRKEGFSTATFYKWQAEFDGMELRRERVPLNRCEAINEVWSMDFVSDSLANGRRIKCLTITDDFSHECVDIAVDHGIGGDYVTRVLDQAARFRGYPRSVRTDQGPEFTSPAFLAWATAKGVRHILNQPGKPTQNAYIEGFNGKLRDECLNEHCVQTWAQARHEIARWRIDFHEGRPHASCGRIPAARLASLHRQPADDAACVTHRTQA